MQDEMEGECYAVGGLTAFKSIRGAVPRDAFCLLCQFPSLDQRDSELREMLVQLETQIKLSNMGIDFKIAAIKKTYDESIQPNLPVDTPIWTIASISSHLNGLHFTSSIAATKRLDASMWCTYMKVLEDHALLVNAQTGVTSLNLPAINFRLKLSNIIQAAQEQGQ